MESATTPTTFRQAEGKLLRGDYLSFRDDGRVSPGSKTKCFTVVSRHTGTILGHVKWYVPWRQYTFFPLNAVFDKKCLRELADYCELATNEHRDALAVYRALHPKGLRRRFPAPKNQGGGGQVPANPVPSLATLLEPAASNMDGAVPEEL